MKFKRLLSPVTIGNMKLKNRIIMPAMHHLYTENGLPTPRFNEYYRKRADGGAAMIIVGACRFDDYGARLSTMSLRDDSTIEPWREFTDYIHETDCKVAVQLYHAGRYMKRADVPCVDDAIAPSAVHTSFTGETARAMTADEIRQVIRDWADGALRAKKAGFDAVEISGSAGYIISQFLSPVSNLRTDEYGGSFENRCRFPLEVIRCVREAVGSDFPILLRMGAHDLIPGSNGNREAVKFAQLAESAGADMLDVTGGWHESTIPQLTGDLPRAGLAYLAAEIKAAVGIPVAMANRIGYPAEAEETLALEKADIIAMGRSLIADPELPNKLTDGREIRPCVACNQGCLANTFFDRPIRCLANAEAGHEHEQAKPSPKSKKLLVIGGGPAGMEFALRSAERGHAVTLWEKEKTLGGQLNLAAALPYRNEPAELVSYYERSLQRLSVNVCLGKETTASQVADRGFDAVILATGREPLPVTLNIKSDSVPVYSPADVIQGAVIPGINVAVIGGSFVGLETARLLAHRGSLSPEDLYFLAAHQLEPYEKIEQMLNSTRRRITVIEKGKIGAGYEPGLKWLVSGDLNRLGVKCHKNSVVTEINRSGVVFDTGNEIITVPCESVIFAGGSEFNSELYDGIKKLAPQLDVRVLGNAKKLGRAMQATSSAFEMAMEF